MKNIGLLTKESTNQLKNKWMLFLFFLLFLIISMAIITGLIHFTYSFGHDAKWFDTLDRYSSVEVHGPANASYINTKDGDYYKYVSHLEKYDSENNLHQLSSDDVDTLMADKGNTWKHFPKGLAEVDKSGKTLAKSSEYLNNAFMMWTYRSGLKDYANSSNSQSWLQLSIPGPTKGLFKDDKVDVSMFFTGPETDYSKAEKNGTPIYDWEQRKIDAPSRMKIQKAIRGFSIDDFNVNNVNDVMVTPRFLKANHVKLGQTIPLIFGTDIFRVRIAAEGLAPSETVSNHNGRIAFNPILFNKYYDAEIGKHKSVGEDFNPEIQIINPNVPFANGEYEINQFYQAQYDTVYNKFKYSFNGDGLDIMVNPVTYGSTPIKSYHMQLMIYNLFSWIVTAILIALLIVAYWFIQGLIIKSNKSLLINLKAIGVNQFELGFYLGISFLPILIVGSGIGLAIGEFLYWLCTTTLGNAVGFVMKSSPESVLGYIIFVCIFVALIIIGAAMSLNGTRGGALSIHSKNKLSVIEKMFLGIKSWKMFENSGFANVIYSFQISNMLKAFATFIVTILSLTVLGTSLQFIQSIGGTLDKKPFMYEHVGKSLSFREYDDKQIENSTKPISQYHELQTDSATPLRSGRGKHAYQVPKDQDVYEYLLKWGAGFINNPKNTDSKGHQLPMYDEYFDQLYDLDDYFKDNYKALSTEKISEDTVIKIATDNGISRPTAEKIYGYIGGHKAFNYLDTMDRTVLTYKSNFGKKAVQPKIFFRNRPSDRQLVGFQEMHDGEMAENQSEIKLFDSNKSKYNLDYKSIVINNFIKRRMDYDVGDTIKLRFSDISKIALSKDQGKDSGVNHVYNNKNNGVTTDPLEFTIVGVDDTLYNQQEGILNFDAIRQHYNNYEHLTVPATKDITNPYANGAISRNVVPYDMEYLTIPVGLPNLVKNPNDSGASIWDYFPDALNSDLLTNFNFSSLPVIKHYYMMKTAEFRSFASIISGFLAVVAVAIVCVISILIAYENKKNILVMKTLGYNTARVIFIFSTIYMIMIAIGFIASIFIGGALIDSFTGALADRLGLALTHMYTAETILVPFAIAVVFCATIIGIIVDTYKRTSVDEITFAE